MHQTYGLNEEVIFTIKFSSKMVITCGNHEHRVCDRKQIKDHCYLLHIGMLFIIQPSHRQEQCNLTVYL